MKKILGPRLSLHRETLRNLERESLGGVAGGITNVATSCTVTRCGHTCPSACHTCTC
ncbi:MAG TPA: class I lanthipeptide [Thermoanaerobaculia bacterium]|jgi:hypothetical protein|nr:class I lanthipeptide [Thermoanaerobaculia bacterium]